MRSITGEEDEEGRRFFTGALKGVAGTHSGTAGLVLPITIAAKSTHSTSAALSRARGEQVYGS